MQGLCCYTWQGLGCHTWRWLGCYRFSLPSNLESLELVGIWAWLFLCPAEISRYHDYQDWVSVWPCAQNFSSDDDLSESLRLLMVTCFHVRALPINYWSKLRLSLFPAEWCLVGFFFSGWPGFGCIRCSGLGARSSGLGARGWGLGARSSELGALGSEL